MCCFGTSSSAADWMITIKKTKATHKTHVTAPSAATKQKNGLAWKIGFPSHGRQVWKDSETSPGNGLVFIEHSRRRNLSRKTPHVDTESTAPWDNRAVPPCWIIVKTGWVRLNIVTCAHAPCWYFLKVWLIQLHHLMRVKAWYTFCGIATSTRPTNRLPWARSIVQDGRGGCLLSVMAIRARIQHFPLPLTPHEALENRPKPEPKKTGFIYSGVPVAITWNTHTFDPTTTRTTME